MKLKITLCAAFICLLSAIATAQSVYVDYNHNTDFTKSNLTLGGKARIPNAINDSILAQRAQQAIDSQLAAKGLQKVEESQHPDLIGVTAGGMKQETSYNVWGTGGWG